MYLAIFLAGLIAGTRAGLVGLGEPCSTSKNHVDPISMKFISECTDQAFCSSSGLGNGTCQLRLCRRDEYPFGFDDQPLPRLCPPGTFCPDEGTGCEPLKPVGGSCELNRDEQCTPPGDRQDLTSVYNSRGAICLNFVCRHANASLGQQCIRDSRTYLDFGPDGKPYNYTITRDDCRSPHYFCDGVQKTCVETKALGASCNSDIECSTHYCGNNLQCAELFPVPFKVSTWQWVLLIVIIVLAMITTCILLNLLHARYQRKEAKELREYYVDQLSLRRAIIALHVTAAETQAKIMEYHNAYDDAPCYDAMNGSPPFQ